MMPIAFAALGEPAVIGLIAPGIEHAPRCAVPGHAFPPQIGQMGTKRRSPRPVPHNAGLHGHMARPVRHEPRGGDARGTASAKSAAGFAAGRSAANASGFLSRDQRLGDEWLGATAAASTPIPDASEPDVEIVIAGHGARVHEVCVVVKVQ